MKGFRFQVNKKTLKVCQSTDHPYTQPDSYASQRLRREMGIWRRLNHPNVMEFMGYAFGFGISMALVAPWAANGTLTDCLAKSWSIITVADQLSLV